MASAKAFLLVSLIFCLNACHSKNSGAGDKFIEHDMSRATIDIDLPTALWDRIEAVYHPNYVKAKEEPKAEPKAESKSKKETEEPKEMGDEILDEVVKEYVPIAVKLI